MAETLGICLVSTELVACPALIFLCAWVTMFMLEGSGLVGGHHWVGNCKAWHPFPIIWGIRFSSPSSSEGRGVDRAQLSYSGLCLVEK